MWIYVAPFGVFLCLTGIAGVVRRRDMLVLVGFTTALCALMAGLRADTDNDWATYLDIFESIPSAVAGPNAFFNSIADLYLEPAFALFVALIKVPFSDRVVFGVIASLSLWIYYSGFKRVTRFPAIAFLVYVGDGFYLREFTQLRFGLAVAIGFASLVVLMYGQQWKHRGLALLAASVHYTGFVLLISQGWVRFVSTRRRVFWVATILLAMSLLGAFDGLVNTLAANGLAPLRLLSYLDNEQDSAAVSQAILLGHYVLLLVSLRMAKDRDTDFFWVSLYALSFALVCIFSGFDLMRRVSFFFSPALYVLASVGLSQRRYLSVCLFVVYAATLLAARFTILQPYGTWLALN